MENLKKLWVIILLTTVLAYLTIGFVRWEFDWIKHLADADSMSRFYFFGGVVIKVVLDILLWKAIKRHDLEEPRRVKEQADLSKEINKPPHNING